MTPTIDASGTAAHHGLRSRARPGGAASGRGRRDDAGLQQQQRGVRGDERQHTPRVGGR